MVQLKVFSSRKGRFYRVSKEITRFCQSPNWRQWTTTTARNEEEETKLMENYPHSRSSALNRSNARLCNQGYDTGAWSGIDTLSNCNKVERYKICKYIGKLTQERKNFENLSTSVGVTCIPAYCPSWLLGRY